MIGEMLGQKYKLVRLLGAGGMGSVYEAEQQGAIERVAVKVMHGHLLEAGSDAVQRFRREARAAGTTDSNHIVKVLDSGTDEAKNILFLVMEYLDGEDLQRLLDRQGPLPPTVALAMAFQTLAGLSKAHSARVVHRDIKPANLFLARRPDGAMIVKLLDFGIAKIKADPLKQSPTTDLTTTGGFLGSPLYMSPEQVQDSRDVDHRTDLWSLGSVLYYALAGRAPYQHLLSLAQLMVAICTTPPPPLTEVAPWVPPEVAKVVHKALEPKPEARYPSAASMLAAIQRLLPAGAAIRQEMLARGSERSTAPRRVVDLGATTPIQGDETTEAALAPEDAIIESVGRQQITVDPRRLLGPEGERWTFSVDLYESMFTLLTDIWASLRRAGADIPPETYGVLWVLVDPATGRPIEEKTLKGRRALSLEALGLRPGSVLWLTPVDSAPPGEVRSAAPDSSPAPSVKAKAGAVEKRYRVGESTVVLTVGDITRESTDAIVNATNELLHWGGGVDGAMHRAAGPELDIACQRIRETLLGRRLAPGQAVVTPGFRLRGRYVIHCVGPIYAVDPVAARVELGDCFRNALRICRERGLRSIAFPAISTGTNGYPIRSAALIALSVLRRELAAHPLPELARVVLINPATFQLFTEVADRTF